MVLVLIHLPRFPHSNRLVKDNPQSPPKTSLVTPTKTFPSTSTVNKDFTPSSTSTKSSTVFKTRSKSITNTTSNWKPPGGTVLVPGIELVTEKRKSIRSGKDTLGKTSSTGTAGAGIRSENQEKSQKKSRGKICFMLYSTLLAILSFCCLFLCCPTSGPLTSLIQVIIIFSVSLDGPLQ